MSTPCHCSLAAADPEATHSNPVSAVARPQQARRILLESDSGLGLKHGAQSSLLDLGTRLRCRELVTHDLSQGVLDDQWRGRDPKCGRVCVKLDNLSPYAVLPHLVLLTLFGWTGVGGFIVPIVPNDYVAKIAKRRLLRRRWTERVLAVIDIYRIPCVKHIMAILAALTRFGVSLPFALGSPRSPLDAYDGWVLAFVLSAALAEARQLRRHGYEYLNVGRNRLDLAFIAVALAGIVERLLGSLVLSCAAARGIVCPQSNLSSQVLLDLTNVDNGSSAGSQDASHVDTFEYGFRVTMALLALLQGALLTRLLAAFEPVGVLIEALTLMLVRVQIALVPYILVAISASVCFHLFRAPDRWLSPWRRFVGADEVDATDPTVFFITWVYTLAVDITILNLMIAIMTDTYFKVARTLAVELYRMSRVGLVSEFIHRAAMPQPLDVGLLLLQITSLTARSAFTCLKSLCIKGSTRSDVSSAASYAQHAAQNALGAIGELLDQAGLKHDPEMEPPISTDHWVARAQLEYLASVRRREEKDAAQAAESEAVLQIKENMVDLTSLASDTSQLLLQMRRELLEQRASSAAMRMQLEKLDRSWSTRQQPNVCATPTLQGMPPRVTTELSAEEHLASMVQTSREPIKQSSSEAALECGSSSVSFCMEADAVAASAEADARASEQRAGQTPHLATLQHGGDQFDEMQMPFGRTPLRGAMLLDDSEQGLLVPARECADAIGRARKANRAARRDARRSAHRSSDTDSVLG